MDKTVEHIEFAMYCAKLVALPERPLPDGYSIRTFQPGDERSWAEIETRAGEFTTLERGMSSFNREFGAHPDWLPTRMFFLVHERDGLVGTASGWVGECFGRTMGQLHWVAIVPEHQGKGLARTLVGRALERLKHDGEEAYLTTQTTSWRAVAMYRSFGFSEVVSVPEIARAVAIVDARIAGSNR